MPPVHARQSQATGQRIHPSRQYLASGAAGASGAWGARSQGSRPSRRGRRQFQSGPAQDIAAYLGAGALLDMAGHRTDITADVRVIANFDVAGHGRNRAVYPAVYLQVAAPRRNIAVDATALLRLRHRHCKH